MDILRHNMAVIYIHLKDYESAIFEFNKLLESKHVDKNEDLIVTAHYNVASCYRHQKLFENSISHVKLSKDFADKRGDNYAIARAILLHCELLTENGFTIDANNLLLENDVFFADDSSLVAIQSNIVRSKIAAGLGFNSEAKEFLLTAFAQSDKIGLKQTQVELLSSLSELCAAEGDYSAAYEYLNQYRKLNEELLDKERVGKIQQLQIANQLSQITREKELAEQSALSKSNFLSNMSHEIRTPMNAIIGFTDLMLQSSQIQGEERNYLNTIKQSSDNLLHIINEILDYSKIEAGKIEFKQEGFNLEAELKKVQQLFSLEAGKKNLQLTVNIDSSLPAHFIGDSYRLNQIIVNLMGNAIKFTEQGFVGIHVSGLSLPDNKMSLQFKIKDTGIGISQEKIVELFERFKQVSIETNFRYGGTGLGLAISKQLVELQGGSMGVESKMNQGTTFSFTIPYLIQNDDFLKNPTRYLEPNEVFLEPFRVLIADDNPFNQILIKKVISRHFHNAVVESVENGLQVLSMLKRFKYDFVLLDMRMPEMDGITAAQRIRSMTYESFCNVPLVAFTAGVTDEERQKAKDAGMHYFMPKPFTKDDLINLIAELGLISL
jgi:signal transduction histidine kinase/CheY-like chemotaxis protein